MAEEASWRLQRYLDQFQDEGLPADPAWTPEAEEIRQKARIVQALAVAQVAKSIPRRLGGDASDVELRLDKRLARQVEARLFTWKMAWSADVPDLTDDPDVRAEGAQLTWSVWWEEHKRNLLHEVTRVATHAKRHGKVQEGNRMVNRLLNECRALDEVLG